MTNNNHFITLDNILRNQQFDSSDSAIDKDTIYNYAECISRIENAITVVSDLKAGKSRIYLGYFAKIFGLKNYSNEDLIWEKEIFSLMDKISLEEKYLAELRFLNFLRHQPKSKHNRYYLISKLRFHTSGVTTEVLHRMYYFYDSTNNNAVRYALCLYSPLFIDFMGQNAIVDSINGELHPLTPDGDKSILSPREKQVLHLIDNGKRSREIAEILSISTYTVSRHRQEILGKLGVKNSIEACRIARNLGII